MKHAWYFEGRVQPVADTFTPAADVAALHLGYLRVDVRRGVTATEAQRLVTAARRTHTWLGIARRHRPVFLHGRVL